MLPWVFPATGSKVSPCCTSKGTIFHWNMNFKVFVSISTTSLPEKFSAHKKWMLKELFLFPKLMRNYSILISLGWTSWKEGLPSPEHLSWGYWWLAFFELSKCHPCQCVSNSHITVFPHWNCTTWIHMKVWTYMEVSLKCYPRLTVFCSAPHWYITA